MKKQLCIYFVSNCLVLTFGSCTMYHYFQMAPAKNETVSAVQDYLTRENIQYTYSTFLDDSLWQQLGDSIHHLNMYKFERKVTPSPIQLRIFDKNGNFVTGYTQCYGSFRKLNILKTYPPVVIPHLPNNPNLRFSNELDLINASDSVKQVIKSIVTISDFTLVLYWNMWSGYFSEVVLKAASEYYQQYRSESSRITLILVNTGVD